MPLFKYSINMIVIDIHSFNGFVVMKIMKRLDDLYVLSTYLAKFMQKVGIH